MDIWNQMSLIKQNKLKVSSVNTLIQIRIGSKNMNNENFNFENSDEMLNFAGRLC